MALSPVTQFVAITGRWLKQPKTQTLLVVTLVICVLAIGTVGRDVWHAWRDQGKLLVYALDVGQGDALLIRFPDRSTMLVDGGPDARVVDALGHVLPFWQRHIDTVLLTHPETDHVGGLPAVLDRYSVGRVVMTGVLHTAPDYLRFLAQIRDQKIPVTIADHPFLESVGDVHLEYLWPRKSVAETSVEALNDTSVVFRMVYGQTTFLFTGDTETPVEEALIWPTPGVGQMEQLRATVLKVGHHGSDTSTSQAFLDAVQPEIALISVGRKNRFGHPSRRVLRRLERVGARIERTDRAGTIRLESDGRSVH